MDIQTEIAWAAGFWDGEGCAWRGLRTDKHNRTYSKRGALICQNDPEALRRFISAVGAGRIYGPYHPPGRKNEYYQMHLRIPEAISVFTKMWPYLSSIKKKQALKCFPELEEI